MQLMYSWSQSTSDPKPLMHAKCPLRKIMQPGEQNAKWKYMVSGREIGLSSFNSSFPQLLCGLYSVSQIDANYLNNHEAQSVW